MSEPALIDLVTVLEKAVRGEEVLKNDVKVARRKLERTMRSYEEAVRRTALCRKRLQDILEEEEEE